MSGHPDEPWNILRICEMRFQVFQKGIVNLPIFLRMGTFASIPQEILV
jgi:hypothetical protein